jgi:hypothetical protein
MLRTHEMAWYEESEELPPSPPMLRTLEKPQGTSLRPKHPPHSSCHRRQQVAVGDYGLRGLGALIASDLLKVTRFGLEN